jgi:hypothetical protein
MSLKVMNHVWTRSKASGAGLLALLAIADCADDSGIAYPSQATIARKARISERNLKRIISELCSTREMEILEKGDGRRSTTYQILMKNDEGCQDVTPQMSQNANFEGCQVGTPGVTNEGILRNEGGHGVTPGVTQLCHPNSHITVMELKTPLPPFLKTNHRQKPNLTQQSPFPTMTTMLRTEPKFFLSQ